MSVIIPSFNYARFLPQCVDSALSQEGVEAEIIIVDDVSKDNSAEIAQAYADQDNRVTFIAHERNLGHIQTFNTGFAVATGEFVVRLDSDDLLAPSSLARAVALFDNFPNVGLVYGHARHFTTPEPPVAQGTIRGWSVWSGHDWLAERCRKGNNVIITPEAVVRMDVMRSIGALDASLTFAQDMEMWLRTACVSDVGHVDGPDQALHRDHSASMSVTTVDVPILDLRERAEVFRVLFEGQGGQLKDAAQLHSTARRALAVEALTHAYQAHGRGPTAAEEADSYAEFALRTFPESRSLPAWKAVQRKRGAGARWSLDAPVFMASRALRPLTDKYEYRRWVRSGI